MKGETKVDLGRQLAECNARLGYCKLKLAEHNRRLAEYHDDEEETTGEEETIDVNLLKKEYLRFFIGTTIGDIMIACGTGIFGYFGGDIMTIKNIMTVVRIGEIVCCVGLFMGK